MLRKTVFLVVWFITIKLSGQNLSITNSTGPSAISGCASSINFAFNVNSAPNSFNTSDVVHIDFLFAQGVQLNQVTSNVGTITTNGNSITVSNLNGANTFEIQYSLSLNCNFPSNNTVFNTHSFNYNLNASTPQTFNYNTPYACAQSVLVFDGGTNLNYNNALLNTPFTRTYIFKNSSNVPFTGKFTFDDNAFDPGNATYNFTGISLLPSVNAGTLVTSTTSINAHIELQINGLAQGQSFTITETGHLLECSGAVDNSRTIFTAQYGCNTNDLCRSVESNIAQEAFARVSQEMPVVQFTNDQHLENCINSITHRTYTITNVGLGAANKASLMFSRGGVGPIIGNSYFLDNIDQNSIFAAINGVPATTTYSTSASGYYVYILVNGNIEPGQSVVIEYDETFNCIPETGYGNYFDKTAILHNLHPLYVSLSHPCLGDIGNYTGPFYSHPQELKQTFTNLNGQMLGGPPSSAWFNIDNATPLILGNFLAPFNNNPAGTYLVPYNLANAEFEVRLKLETGLRLTNNSDFYLTSQIGATTVTLNPLPGDVINPNTGQGDIVTAKFHFPANWCTPYVYNGHNYWATTTEFNQFFNSFKVNFQLEANCAYAPPNGVAHITEQCFINPTPACEDCKLPLCQVTDFTNINCPGCVLPGWNITSFDINRITVGYSDTDNNHLLDVPLTQASQADPNVVNTSAAMIGDIIEGSITGYLSDGQDFGLDLQGNSIPVGFTFGSAGFVYDEGLLNFTGGVIQHLQFVSATGTLTLSDGTQTNFAITSADILPQTNCIGIPMSIQDLIGYGAQGLSDYSTITNLELHPKFKVIHNLTDGVGNPYYSVRAINCFYYISGSEFTDACNNFQDANDHISDLLNYPETRSNYQYWCTSYEGRFMGTGVDLRKTYLKASENTRYNSIPSISLCSKSISYNYWVSVGKEYITDPQSGAMNQTSATIFNNEVRPIGTLDELTFNYPADYEPEKITFHNFDASYDASNNLHNWYYDVNHNFDYPVYANGLPTNSVNIGADHITIYPSQFISSLTTQPPYGSIPQYYSAFEENQYYMVSIYLRPKDCSNLPELSDFSNNTIQSTFSNFPLNTVTQTTTNIETIDVSNLKNGLSFRNPNPILTLTTPSGINPNNNLVSWDVALTTNAMASSPYPLDEAIIRSAENTFVSFRSPSGNFSNMSIGGNVTTFMNANSTQAPSVLIPNWSTDFANQSAGYALDFVGYNYNEDQIISKQFKINADFNCANLTPGATDYITVYKGWNCFNSPNSVLSSCKHDSVNLYFTVPETEVQISFQHETTISTCSTTSASITFDPIMGVTQSVSVELQSSPSGAYTYIPGSAYYTSDDGNGGITTTYIEPIFTNGVWIWNLNAIGDIFSQPTVLYYQLQTSCGFESGQTIQHVTAKNSCGLVIANLTDTWSPQVISNLPQPNSVEVAVDDINLSGCQNDFSIQLTITNAGNNSTTGTDHVVFPLPSNVSYTGNNPGVTVTNNELHINVPANINPGNNYLYTLPLSYTAVTCTVIPLQFSVTHNIAYACGNETCTISYTPTVIETATINVNLPVYTVSDVNTGALCNNGNTLYFTLNSTNTNINDNTTVSIIDLNNGNVLGSTSITLPFNNSQSMSVILNGNSNNLSFVFSGCNCNSAINYSYSCPCKANAGTDMTICEGDMVTLTAGGGGSYLWMPGNYNTASINVNPQQTTTYIVTVTNGSSSCTDEVTVFVKPMPEIIVTGQDSVCKGQNSTTLYASMTPAGGSFVWTIPPSNIPVGNTNEFNTGLLGSTTIYNVSATLNGCTTTTTYPVIVIGNINVSLTANPTELCSGESVILIAGGAGLNGTYFWNPTPLNVSLDGTQATYAPLQTTSYTVTGTNTIGCEDETIINVIVRDCQCEGNDVPTVINSNTQTNFTGDVFEINSNTQITTNTIFEDASVVFRGAYKIIVNNGATLTLKHAHLWACENMWNGIKVQPGGRLIVLGNSLIEDADSAIYVKNPMLSGAYTTILEVDECTFNKNYTGITIDNYSANSSNYPFIIRDVVFTKREINFINNPPFTVATNPWPTTSSYKVLANSGTINEHCIISDNYASASLKNPHSADNSKYGIKLNNIGNINNNWNANNIVYNGILIGGINLHKKNNMNLYDNIETGIYAVSSNFTNINSTFQYMVSVNASPTINDADGIGIFAFKFKGNDNMYKATIKEGLFSIGPQCINKFYDNRYGVLINNYAVSEITNSDVRSTQINDQGNLGSIGFDVVTSKFKSIAINSNTITNVRYGIVFTGHQNSVFGPVSVDNNIIQAHFPNLPYLASQFVRQGIFALTSSISSPVQSNTIVSTSNNILLDVDNGIVTSKWQALKSVTNNNYIRMVYRLGNVSSQIGIDHRENHANEIINNRIEDDPNNNVLYSVDDYKGIYSKLCLKESVTCNVVAKLGNGIEFDSNHSNSVKFSNNTFDNNFKGYVLSNNANIGNQFNSMTPSDNKWINFSQGTFHTFVNFSNPLLSKLYIRPNLQGYLPTLNGSFGGSAYSFNTSILAITNNPKELICTPANAFSGNRIASCDNCNDDIGQNQFNYYVYPNPAQNEVYISTNDKDLVEAWVDITDITGKHITSIQLYFENGTSKFNLNIENGAYFLNIQTDNVSKSSSHKLIIMK